MTEREATRTYGPEVRWLRQGARLSGRELCRRVGITPSYLSDIESGRRLPAPTVSDKIASAVRTDPDALWRLALLERLSERDLRTLGAAAQADTPTPEQFAEIDRLVAESKAEMAAQADPAPGGGLREALDDANRIISMTRDHLRRDHPDCAYEALGVLNDASRAALAAPSRHAAPDPADLARWLQEWAESQPAITIRRGVEPQVAWRALADELLRKMAAK